MKWATNNEYTDAIVIIVSLIPKDTQKIENKKRCEEL